MTLSAASDIISLNFEMTMTDLLRNVESISEARGENRLCETD